MNPANLEELEIKIAFLERHIEEQDKVIMRLSNDLDYLKSEVARIAENQRSREASGNEAPADEKPPHY